MLHLTQKNFPSPSQTLTFIRYILYLAQVFDKVTSLDEQGKDLLYLDDDYDTSIPLLRWSEDPSALDRFDLDEYHTMGSHFERAESSDAVVLLARLELSPLYKPHLPP